MGKFKDLTIQENEKLMRVYDNVHEAYLETLKDVYTSPDCISSPRDQKVREKFNYQFSITNPKVEYIVTKDLERNKVIAEYSQKEFDLYQSGSNRVEDFAKASLFWNKLANPDKTVNSAYGFLIWHNKSHGSHFETEMVEVRPFWDPDTIPDYEKGKLYRTQTKMRTPWEWAKQALVSDKDTRQSILRFSLPEHFWNGNKDFTCTLHGYFQIRNNKLDLTVNMRSNDLTLGLVYDLPWFISLIHKMKDELQETYPGLEVGTYTHYVHNIHVYERDGVKILRMLGIGNV